MLRNLSLHLLQWAESKKKKKTTWSETWELNESLFESTKLSNSVDFISFFVPTEADE